VPIPKARSTAAIVVLALTIVHTWGVKASTAPQRLDCVLTDTADKLGSEARPIVVVVDETAKTLQVQDGDQNYNLNNVSISTISISGDTDRLSLGIDRSSFGIVWQQYQANKVAIEFGQCHQANNPAAIGSQ